MNIEGKEDVGVEHLEENVAAADLKIDANKWQELDRMAFAG
ncbi:MAG: hypothetical protein WBV36_24220 [Terriglobales bacterium]